jgi:hypothetical protein
MADVEMSDAPVANKAEDKGKAIERRKKFEVKKVPPMSHDALLAGHLPIFWNCPDTR